MGLDIDSRREHKQGEFVYLLDDEEKTLNGRVQTHPAD